MARMTTVGDWLSHCVVEVVVLVLGMVQLVNWGYRPREVPGLMADGSFVAKVLVAVAVAVGGSVQWGFVCRVGVLSSDINKFAAWVKLV
jgi:hypothetical protein